jgi:predicted nucleotidyltransferase
MKSDYSAIGMAYLEPRIKDLMPCIGYVFSNPLRDDYSENSFRLCMPMNGGPCVYGCGYIKYFKFWYGKSKPPLESELHRVFISEYKEQGNDWFTLLNEKYPQIQSIKLFGSRAKNPTKAGSDYDLLIQLGKECKFNDLSKRIAFDIDLMDLNFGADLWFLRQDGLIVRYEKAYLKQPLDSYVGFWHNTLIKNTLSPKEACCTIRWSKLYESIQTAEIIFQRQTKNQ